MSPTPSLDKDKVEAKGCCPCPKTEVKAKIGDTVILPCSINLSPWNPNKVLLCWEKRLGPGNNVTVHSQRGVHMEVDQGKTFLPFWKDGKGDLELRDVVPSDSGVYTFWISDEEEKHSMCCEVTLIVDQAKETVDPGEKKCSQVDAKGCCPRPKTEVKAESGDTVILPCTINLSAWNPNKVLLSWEKRLGPGKNVTVHSQKGVHMEGDQGRTSLPFWKDGKGDLELRDVVSSDSGDYTFWITQVSDEEEKQSKCYDVTLIVNPAEETVDPGKKKCCQVDAKGCCPGPKTEVKAKSGDTVILPCAINLSAWNPNKVLLCWQKRLGPDKNVTVHSQKGVHMEGDQGRTSLPFWKDGKGNLELRDVVPSDSGDYTFWITQVSDEEEKQSKCCDVILIVNPAEETVDPGKKKCCQGCHGGQKKELTN